jgi:hypothetical protein
MFGRDHAKYRHGRACHPFDVNDGKIVISVPLNTVIVAVESLRKFSQAGV